jgi:superfamily II DNA or RNA helicase
MVCCSEGLSNDGSVHLHLECETCGRPGWTPGDGNFYDWSIISPQSKRLVAAPDPRFIRSLYSQPKRTRLDVMVEAWGINRRNRKDQLIGLNNLAGTFGLQFIRLYAPSDNLLKDEPLLLTYKGGEGIQDLEISESTYGSFSGHSVEEPLLNEMLEDLDLLKQRLAECDAGQRNRPNSIGLREKQMDAIQSVLETTGNITIGSLPTGSGKTRIAQSIAWALRRKQQGPMLMISPLISLMDDQRAQWHSFSEDLQDTDLALHSGLGFRGTFLTSVEETPTFSLMTDMTRDEIDLLCCSPETLMSSFGEHPMWIDRLTSLDNPVSCLVIDEAHVVGDWGASIRPDFQLLSWIKDRLLKANPQLRVLLLSATISRNEEEELRRLFGRGLQSKPPVRNLVTREDLYFHVEIQQNESDGFDFSSPIIRISDAYRRIPLRWYEDQVQSLHRPPCIIYTPQKSHAEGVVSQLARQHFGNVRRYTGNTSNEQRETIREDFISNRFECLIATSAFGMGIDKPDVWISSYIGMPFTVKGLYQGFGRAARNSRWRDNSDFCTRRNGVCYAVIPNDQPRSFRAQLGKPKSIERMFDLFCSDSTIYLPNGFVLLPIMENIDFAAWQPSHEISGAYVVEQEADDDETEDTQDDYLIHQSMRTEQQVIQDELAKLKRFQALYKARLWVLACLNRTDSVEFLGIHRSVLLEEQHGTSSHSLVDVLSESGYDGVLDLLNTIPSGFLRARPENNRKYAVLKFRTRVANWNDLSNIMVEGHETLHRRHTQGRDELKSFIDGVRKGTCIRTLFASSIGAVGEDVTTCSQMPNAIPCSNCRRESLAQPFTWSDEAFMGERGWIDLVSSSIDLESITRAEFNELMLDLPPDVVKISKIQMSTEIFGIPRDIRFENAEFKLPFTDNCPVYHFPNEQRPIQSGILIYQGDSHKLERQENCPPLWTYLFVFNNEKLAVVV